MARRVGAARSRSESSGSAIDQADEYSVIWNDPDVDIDWPIAEPLLSDRDRAAPTLRDIEDRLPVYGAE